MSEPTPRRAARPEPRTLPSTEPEPGRRLRNRRTLLVAGGAVLGGLVLLYLVGFLLAGEKIPRKAVISGVAVGGLSRPAATDRLRTELEPRLHRPLTVQVDGQQGRVTPAAAGLGINYDQTLTEAGGGRSFDPRAIVGVLVGGSASTAVVEVDQSQFDTTLDELAPTLEKASVDATLAYEGTTVVRTPSRPGSAVARAGAAPAIGTAAVAGQPTVDLPTVTAEPDITTAEADQVAEAMARPAVAGPIILTAPDAGSAQITPKMIAPALTFVPRNGSLTARLDPKTLAARAKPALASVDGVLAKDAKIVIAKGKPKITPSRDGQTIEPDQLVAAVQSALTKTGAERKAAVKVTTGPAKFSTADAKKLGIKEVTGKFTTYFPYLPYRNVNIGRAADLIDGTLLKPGDTFSLNQVVGERTKANGFVEGYIISGGKFKKELGGGVSQSATTTFNAMFFAGLKDVQHQPHSLYIDRYPAGREATVAWPSVDLKFTNDTDHGVLVQASLVKGTPTSRGSITVKMWSTKVYDRVRASDPVRSRITTGRDLEDDSPTCEPQSPVTGFDVDYQRLFYRDQLVVKREKFRWRYSPTDKVTCT